MNFILLWNGRWGTHAQFCSAPFLLLPSHTLSLSPSPWTIDLRVQQKVALPRRQWKILPLSFAVSLNRLPRLSAGDYSSWNTMEDTLSVIEPFTLESSRKLLFIEHNGRISLSVTNWTVSLLVQQEVALYQHNERFSLSLSRWQINTFLCLLQTATQADKRQVFVGRTLISVTGTVYCKKHAKK